MSTHIKCTATRRVLQYDFLEESYQMHCNTQSAAIRSNASRSMKVQQNDTMLQQNDIMLQQNDTMHYSSLCCNVLLCAAMCCSVLRCVVRCKKRGPGCLVTRERETETERERETESERERERERKRAREKESERERE